jgi:hypothetical protein
MAYGPGPRDPCTDAFRSRSEGTCRGTWEEVARGEHHVGGHAHKRSIISTERLARPVGLGAYRRPSIQPKGNKALWMTDEREQYCTEAILRPCVYRESPNGT